MSDSVYISSRQASGEENSEAEQLTSLYLLVGEFKYIVRE